MIVPLFVGREKSIRALEEVMRADKQILLATQQNPSEDEPKPETLYDVGTLASVLQLLKLPDGTVKVLVEGAGRAEIRRFTDNESYYEAHAHRLPEVVGDTVEVEALARSVMTEFENYVKLNKKISPGGGRRGRPDRRLFQARRHGRLAPRRQDRREAGASWRCRRSSSGWSACSA